jgi:hypothetical protein
MCPTGVADFLDRASSELLRLEEQNDFPAGLRVHPEMFDLMAGLRKKELDEGFPLLVLGLPVAPEASLGADEYRLIR